MKCVFQASHGLEAHVVAGLLDQVGIFAQVHGDMLQGAVGELPAAGLATVWVAENDESRARQVVADFEATQPSVETTVQKPPQRSDSFLGGFALGLMVGVALMLLWR